MRHLASFLALILLGGLLLGSTCVEPDIDTTEPLPAPAIIDDEITVLFFHGTYQEVIHLRWAPPEADPGRIAEYRLIRKARSDSDAVVITGIPDTITDYYGPTEELREYAGTSRPIHYRLFAVDTQGVAGDTSAVCSVFIAPHAILAHPEPTATLTTNLFQWSARSIATAYLTRMAVWDTAGMLWQGEYHDQRYTGPYEETVFSDHLPDTLYPLPPGSYWWGAELHIQEIPSTSVKVGIFHVEG